jgi:hypothetical protein
MHGWRVVLSIDVHQHEDQIQTYCEHATPLVNPLMGTCVPIERNLLST